MPRRKRKKRKGTPDPESQRAHYLPTAEDIKKATEEIQAGWSLEERERRDTTLTAYDDRVPPRGRYKLHGVDDIGRRLL